MEIARNLNSLFTSVESMSPAQNKIHQKKLPQWHSSKWKCKAVGQTY